MGSNVSRARSTYEDLYKLQVGDRVRYHGSLDGYQDSIVRVVHSTGPLSNGDAELDVRAINGEYIRTHVRSITPIDEFFLDDNHRLHRIDAHCGYASTRVGPRCPAWSARIVLRNRDAAACSCLI